ncbi:MAG TPA: Hint domain-containing protein [Saprospiraceae bacterium]|nr:Hint domain-containing protein [Saprospiraceae bacterium]
MALAALPLVAPIQDVKPDDMVKAYHHEQSYYATADNNEDIYLPRWYDQMVADVGSDWSDTKSLQNAGTETNWISASTKAKKNGKYLDYDLIHITPETWQIGTFKIIEANGDIVEVEANRPKTWYSENNVNAIGDKAYFSMPEIGINGEATLLSIRPTVINTTEFALNKSGQVDRPVITTFKRNAPIVYDYHFSDGAVIGATPEHPFFSVDRNNYIAVGELQLGEQVMTAGEKVVKFIAGKQRDKGEPVYNFEVWREHNYYVGDRAIFDDSQNGSPKATSKRVNREAASAYSGEFLLVHNTYAEEIKNFIYKMSKADKQGVIDDAWGLGFPEWFKRGRFMEELLGATRYKGWEWTGKYSSNFPGVDFFKKVSGKNVAASVKTTKNETITQWLGSNRNHLNDLKNGKLTGEFSQGTNKVLVDQVEIHIYTPKSNFSQAMEAEWTVAIKAEFPEIKVIISDVEKHVGL